jgi:CheY-like chemotaxis protein
MATEPQVLVVEDDEEIRDVLLELLEDHGYTSVGAANGREALDKLFAMATLPRLILLDLMMPVMDGKAFREVQLRTPAIQSIPVLVISAFRNLEASLLELRPNGHLKKPLEVPLLLELVERYVRAQEGAS